jgi:hypothetical protein
MLDITYLFLIPIWILVGNIICGMQAYDICENKGGLRV